MILILPEGLDLAQHIRLHPPANYGIKKFRIELAEYLVTLIFQIPAHNKKLAESIVDGYVPMNAQLLQKRCGKKDYRTYLDYLLHTGILQSDNYFISSKWGFSGKSRGYRLANRSENKGFKFKPITDRKLRRTLFRELKENADPEYSHLTKWLGAKSLLTIDLPAAMLYLEELRDFWLNNPELNAEQNVKFRLEISKGKSKKISVPKDPRVQFDYAYINALTIYQRAIYSQVDVNVGRLHTPLTNSKSELRHFITHGKERLVSIDLKNSQPYLSNIFFNPAFWSVSEEKIAKNEAKNSDKVDFRSMKATFKFLLNTNNHKLPQTNSTPLIILGEMSKLIDIEMVKFDEEKILSEVEQYKKLTSDGSLYEYLKDEFSVVLGSAFKNKRAVKSIIFTVFFTDNRYQDEVKQLFKKLFPVVTKIFSIIKRKDRTILPRLLQSIEAYLFLQVITKEVARINSRIPLYTIHDSIVTTEQYVPVVRKVMREVLTRYIGAVPTFSEEKWSPSELPTFERVKVA